jgi:hypothetical protein
VKSKVGADGCQLGFRTHVSIYASDTPVMAA